MTARETDRGGADRGAVLERVWAALRWAADRARKPEAPADNTSYTFDAGNAIPVNDANGQALLTWSSASGWVPAQDAPASARAMLDLYTPICNAASGSPLTVGHLGQSIDGHIAVQSGDSYYVTGAENLLHLHRMRALCDAVVVGAGTVKADDPQLTTRRVSGSNPVRVIVDPRRRLAATHRVFTDDQAPTLLVCDRVRKAASESRAGSAELLGISVTAGRVDLRELLAALHSRGLCSVFVEGGGHTVSAFLEADLLDRLQVAIAPVITGTGRPGLRLAPRQAMKDSLRPAHRVFAMGDDVLFDCDLRSSSQDGNAPLSGGLSRIL